MSEKLFSRLYWRPYILVLISVLLIFVASFAPSVLPHVWLDRHIPGYHFYMFKTVAWMVKIGLLIYLISFVRAMTADYFPEIGDICKKHSSGAVTGYKKTWDRGSQLRPYFTFTAEGREYCGAINEAKGSRGKNGDSIENGFTIGARKKLIYSEKDPVLFYIPGEEIYSRKAAILRYVFLSCLFFLELYVGFISYSVH